MSDVLSSINHTTLEALGFKNVSRSPIGESIETFVLGKLVVKVTVEGTSAAAIGGSRKQLTYEEIVALAVHQRKLRGRAAC